MRTGPPRRPTERPPTWPWPSPLWDSHTVEQWQRDMPAQDSVRGELAERLGKEAVAGLDWVGLMELAEWWQLQVAGGALQFAATVTREKRRAGGRKSKRGVVGKEVLRLIEVWLDLRPALTLEEFRSSLRTALREGKGYRPALQLVESDEDDPNWSVSDCGKRVTPTMIAGYLKRLKAAGTER